MPRDEYSRYKDDSNCIMPGSDRKVNGWESTVNAHGIVSHNCPKQLKTTASY